MKEKCLLFSYIFYSSEFMIVKAKLKNIQTRIVDLELYCLHESLGVIII